MEDSIIVKILEKFQLSHDFSVMEIMQLGEHPGLHRSGVSIEPRLFSHGNVTSTPEAELVANMFQLSHDFSVMEIIIIRR